MDVLEHDSDSEPSEIVEHKGYTYENKWKTNARAITAHDWVLWKCVERSCAGQIATAAVRTKRWRRKRFAVHRDVASNRLMAFVPQRPHNHAPMTAHGNEKSRQIGTVTAIAKQTPVLSPSTNSTNALAASSIKISNVNDAMELQAVKPVHFIDHQTNSEESHLKDISVTVDGSNIENIKKKNVQIKHSNLSMSTENEIEEILCNICDTLFDKFSYNQHIQSPRHLSACEEHFKDRIDFENYRIFSCSVCVTTTEFFNSIEQYFSILVNHILLEHSALIVDVYFFALYHEDSLNIENKNIAEVKHFDVYNKKLTKNTDVYDLYKDIVKSFVFQSDALITAESSWTLEEILYIEISIAKKLSENEVALKPLVEINDNNEIRNDHINTDALQKTEPLQLIRCKQCSMYVVQQNYKLHIETTTHKISLLYLKSEKIQINVVQSDNCFLSCRILSPKHVSIDHFFQSIKSDVLELISRIIELQNNEPINVKIKMFGLYNHNQSDNLGDVKSFMIRNEILSGVTILFHWIQKILNTFKIYHQQYLNSMPKSYFLERVMFLDICFYEMTDI